MSMWGMHPSINMRCLITTRPFSANGRHSRGSELESWRESMDGSQQCPVGWQLSKSRFVGGVTKKKVIQAKPAPILSDNDKAAYPGNVSRGLLKYLFIGWNHWCFGDQLGPKVKNLRALHALGKPLCGRLWPHNVCLLLKMCLPYEETFQKLQSVRNVSDKEVANSNQNEGVDCQSCRLPWPFLSSWVGGKQSKTCTQFRWRSKSDLVSIRKQPTNQQFLNGSFNQPTITNQPL